MESELKQKAPVKLKFTPKVPPRRVPKPEVKREKLEDIDADQAINLLQRFHERPTRAKPKFEKKVQASPAAFSIGGPFSLESSSVLKDSNVFPSSSSSCMREKEYVEPWDYYSNYPVTLPLRRPYSGNPEILDEEEFGESAAVSTAAAAAGAYDDKEVNCAQELGLMEENVDASVFLFQLPPTLPWQNTAEAAAADGKKDRSCGLEDLPAGLMGKMVVYESGAVKLMLGDTAYDVSPGMDCVFAQDVVAINTADKNCCVVSEIHKRAVLTPDVDAILK